MLFHPSQPNTSQMDTLNDQTLKPLQLRLEPSANSFNQGGNNKTKKTENRDSTSVQRGFRATPTPQSGSLQRFRLDQMPMNTPFIIEAISPFEPDTTSASDLSKDLESLGFLPNEQVELLACAPFSGDPLVVRVGLSKFALRRAEAAYIRVRSL